MEVTTQEFTFSLNNPLLAAVGWHMFTVNTTSTAAWNPAKYLFNTKTGDCSCNKSYYTKIAVFMR